MSTAVHFRALLAFGPVVTGPAAALGRRPRASESLQDIAFSRDGMRVLLAQVHANHPLHLRDFSPPALYRQFDATLPAARRALKASAVDAASNRAFGEWYAFRGVWDLAVEMLEEADSAGGKRTAAAPGTLPQDDRKLRKSRRVLHACQVELIRPGGDLLPDPLSQGSDARRKGARATGGRSKSCAMTCPAAPLVFVETAVGGPPGRYQRTQELMRLPESSVTGSPREPRGGRPPTAATCPGDNTTKQSDRASDHCT